MSDETIDLQTAAHELGVHYQTAYKWVRSGKLRATMVMGSYRLEPEVVARFSAHRSRPARPRTRKPRTGLAALSERMYRHLVAGEASQADRMVLGLVDSGITVTAVAQEVLVPALRHLGEEWKAGRMDITVEHRASSIVERILAARYPTPRGRRRGTAAVAALSGDRHALPTLLAATCLREDNWLVHHLGADLPAVDLTRFCEQEDLDLVVLTVTTTKLHSAAIRTAEQLDRLGLRTLVGGPGRSLDELQRLARQPAGGQSSSASVVGAAGTLLSA